MAVGPDDAPENQRNFVGFRLRLRNSVGTMFASYLKPPTNAKGKTVCFSCREPVEAKAVRCRHCLSGTTKAAYLSTFAPTMSGVFPYVLIFVTALWLWLSSGSLDRVQVLAATFNENSEPYGISTNLVNTGLRSVIVHPQAEIIVRAPTNWLFHQTWTLPLVTDAGNTYVARDGSGKAIGWALPKTLDTVQKGWGFRFFNASQPECEVRLQKLRNGRPKHLAEVLITIPTQCNSLYETFSKVS